MWGEWGGGGGVVELHDLFTLPNKSLYMGCTLEEKNKLNSETLVLPTNNLWLILSSKVGLIPRLIMLISSEAHNRWARNLMCVCCPTAVLMKLLRVLISFISGCVISWMNQPQGLTEVVPYETRVVTSKDSDSQILVEH